jgi:cytochrome bd-type quinol oxidase subunit 2
MRKIIILMILAFLVFSIATSLLFIESFMSEGISDYSIIIWNFSISIVGVIVVVTIVAYKRRKKKKKKKKEKKEEVYFEVQDGEYSTEYY